MDPSTNIRTILVFLTHNVFPFFRSLDKQRTWNGLYGIPGIYYGHEVQSFISGKNDKLHIVCVTHRHYVYTQKWQHVNKLVNVWALRFLMVRYLVMFSSLDRKLILSLSKVTRAVLIFPYIVFLSRDCREVCSVDNEA